MIAKHTLIDANSQGGDAKTAIFETIREAIANGKGAFVVKDDGALAALKFDNVGNLFSESLEPN